MQLLERLPRETGRDYALRTIKDNIVKLQLAPGSQISENELAAELQLSRTPVREALMELSMVEESRFMRYILECAVVELDCGLAAPEDIMRLRENVRLQNFYLDSYYPDNLMVLDNEFHGLLFSIARKPQVFALMQNISIHFDRVRCMSLSAVKDLKIVQDHEEIVEAIARKDPAAARELMELHLNRYKIDTAEMREKYPQYFK